MSYLVLAYPTFSAADLAWVEAIRTRHDPQAIVVAPHLTLLFPIAEDVLAPNVLVGHLHEMVAPIPPIALTLRCALVMPEIGRQGGHLFLVPDEGLSDLIRLHDRLYCGPLAPHLRLEIPFIPHITVGAGNDLAALYQVAQALNAEPFALSAQIDRLALVRHAAGVVTTVEHLMLGNIMLDNAQLRGA